MERLVGDYYSNIFVEEETSATDIFNLVQPKVDSLQNKLLTALISLDEVKSAVFYMQSDKSPGPDGLNSAFFQKYWHIVGEDIWNKCNHWLQSGTFSASLTDTHIVLVPKCNDPVNLKYFCPIVLYNVL